MNWDDLRILLTVADAGSVSAAARKLGVDKATVSRRVGSLEQDLGIRLMVRRADGWRPTPAGQRVAGAARSMDSHARELVSEDRPTATTSFGGPVFSARRCTRAAPTTQSAALRAPDPSKATSSSATSTNPRTFPASPG